MRLEYTLGIVLLAVLHVAFSQSQQQSGAPEPSQAGSLDVVANSVTNLAQKISLAIASPKSKTEIFSPVSIAGALSLLLLGSVGNTQSELMNLMGFNNADISFTEIHKSFGKLFRELVSNDPNLKANVPWRENDKCNNYDDDDEEPDTRGHHSKRESSSHLISVANGVFVNQELKLNTNYSSVSKAFYSAEVRRLDFSRDPAGSSAAINQWVQRATKEKIREIVTPDLVNGVPMVLASALYFKAKWENMFVEQDTKPRPFYLNGRDQPAVNIDTMATSGCFPYYDAREINAKIIGLPYQEQKSTMYILLPNDSDRRKLNQIQQNFNLQQFNQAIDKMEVKTGTLVLPKMQLESTVYLKDVLAGMGLRTIFDPATSNLTKITSDVFPFGSTDIRSESRLGTATTTQRPGNLNFPESNLRDPVPIQTPAIPNDSSQIPLQILDTDCNLITNCKLSGLACNCRQGWRENPHREQCAQKPFVFAHQCHSGETTLARVDNSNQGYICVVESYTNVPNVTQNACNRNGCSFAFNKCYCCKHKATQNTGNRQPAEEPPQKKADHLPAISQQQTEQSLGNIAVANRFNTPLEAALAFSSSPKFSPAPQRVCESKTECNRNNCWSIEECSYIYAQHVNANVRKGRNKRQTRPTREPSLFVGQIVHKVNLDINEEGTEGGAVTAVVIDRISSSITVRLDGPFLIYVRNDLTKLPLFYGPVYDPRP